MKVIGFFHDIRTRKQEIQLIKNRFVKEGFIYAGTARNLDDLHYLVELHKDIRVLAVRDFNLFGDALDKLHLVMFASKNTMQLFDVDYENMANILYLKEEVI